MSQAEGTERHKQATGSRWSFRIATIAKIPVRIHVSFFLLPLLAMLLFRDAPGGPVVALLFIVVLFSCVVMHEFGHALTARRFGVETRDVTLYPMGGVAMLEGRLKPVAELWVALAGPAVNVVIALVLGIYFVATGGIPWVQPNLFENGFLYAVFFTNIMLAVFNMIPAFPMDGGRVLRAALALMTDETRATQIAGTIGQLFAIVFGVFGLFAQMPILLLIAFFVFLGAQQEMAATTARSFLEGHSVRDAMQVRFRFIASGESLQTAADMLLAGSQHDFPVVAGADVVGVLTRTHLAKGLATDGPSGYVAGYMQRDVKTAHPETPLEQAIELFSKEDPVPIMVMDGDQVIGMLTQENLSEFIMLKSAVRQSRHGANSA
jgi:Zn-dependent protease/CBS domain-containing protein